MLHIAHPIVTSRDYASRVMPQFRSTTHRASTTSRKGRLEPAFMGLLLMLSACAPSTSAPTAEPQAVLACSALPANDRNPLHSAQTSVVRPLRIEDLPGPTAEDEAKSERIAGIAIDIPAEPGMTRALLERSIHCYRHLSPASTDDPLLIQRADLEVTEQRGYFQISITSEESRVAREIVAAARAQRLQAAAAIE